MLISVIQSDDVSLGCLKPVTFIFLLPPAMKRNISLSFSHLSCSLQCKIMNSLHGFCFLQVFSNQLIPNMVVVSHQGDNSWGFSGCSS